MNQTTAQAMNHFKHQLRTAPFHPFTGMFTQLFEDMGQMQGRDDFPKTFPRVNITEQDGSYTLELLAPGYAKEDLKLHVEHDVLTISSEKEAAKLEENARYTRREFVQQAFQRQFRLPEQVQADKITAEHVNGVLTIKLPKKAVEVPAAQEIAIA
ncbi:MAG: Hsp20/alpha crystallin family protein [Bacteroidetes bacterium]|nr:Hsp20/alpha crystallin family protein [Bacteroidota bacterium]